MAIKIQFSLEFHTFKWQTVKTKSNNDTATEKKSEMLRKKYKLKKNLATYSSIRLSALVSDRDRVWRLWARLPG